MFLKWLQPENGKGDIDKIEILRPLNGGKVPNIQPIIRSVSHYNVMLSPTSEDENGFLQSTSSNNK